MQTVLSVVFSFILAIGNLVSLPFIGSPTPLKPGEKLELSRGNQIIMEKGFVLHSWVPAADSSDRCIPPEELLELGFGPTYYGDSRWNESLSEVGSEYGWSITTGSANGKLPDGKEWLSEGQLKYANDLTAVCFGDEQGYSLDEVASLSEWFKDFRSRHPGVLVHSNQWHMQWMPWEIRNYMYVAQPDMLTYDNYIFDENGSIRDYELGKFLANGINSVRIPAMAGYDGTGRSPIPFGQYLGGYKNGVAQADVGWYESTESQKKLVANMSVTMGAKWLNLFRIIYADVFLLYDTDGNKTEHFEQFAAITKEIRTLSPILTQLQTSNVQVVLGQHKEDGKTKTNARPISVVRFWGDKNLHISGIEVKNTGTENDGLAGDVYIGSFMSLPGADFGSGTEAAKDRQYFALCNALATGNGVRPENQHGSSAETAQEITLKIDGNSAKKLYALSAQTGLAAEVEILNNTCALTLGGGEMQLFYWE